MLENVTVIIPAHNRPRRLRRLLDYYAGTGARLLVPDSSDKPFEGSIDPDTTVYLHRPRMHFFRKLRDVLPLITTDYVLYCADDDFAVPRAIRQITEFLDANPAYVIAQGHYLTFTPGPGRTTFYPRYIRNFDCAITDDRAIARMAREKGMYASLLYGVARTDAFRHAYSYVFDERGEMRFSNLFLAEEFFNHAMLIQGKYATLPCFFSARERIKGSATETTVPLSVIKNSPEYAPEYEGFLTALALMLADAEGLTMPDALARMRRISAAPADTASVTFKRRVNAFMARHKALALGTRLSEWRYHQKGLRAVAGMPSYPCTFSTPERAAIERAVAANPLD